MASSNTSVNHVEPKKQSTLDETVASARIVARITQINGLQFTSPCTRDRRRIRLYITIIAVYSQHDE